jgi:predicted nucleotidyltransferase
MGTIDSLFPATRKKLLAVLYGRAGEEFYLRELVRVAGKGHGVVQRELLNLVEGGLVVREERKGRTYFRANQHCPIFEELKRIIVKTAGLVDVIYDALESMEGVEIAFIYGSISRGEEGPDSDVDVALIGNLSFKNVVSALAPAQEILGREVNPTVFRAAEFSKKAKEKNHFVRSLLDGEKIFVIGSEHDLERLAS